MGEDGEARDKKSRATEILQMWRKWGVIIVRGEIVDVARLTLRSTCIDRTYI